MGYYYNEDDKRMGPIRSRELKQLAQQGEIRPETKVEDGNGRIALAKNVTNLAFGDPDPLIADMPSPFVEEAPTVPAPPPLAVDMFCTHCGNSVSEQAVACMTCGAKPFGYKKFCRYCGVALNPEQIVCVQCGRKITVGLQDVMANFSSFASFTPKVKQAAKSVRASLNGAGMKGIKQLNHPAALASITLAVILVSILFAVGINSSPRTLVGKWEIVPGQLPYIPRGYSLIEEMELLQDGTGIVDGRSVTWKVEKGRLFFLHSGGSGANNYKISGSILRAYP